MGIYEELGVKKFINAWGPMTIMGGSLMRPETVQAMVEASRAFVDLHEMQRKCGERIAELIGVEACYISGGAAAGLAIATSAAVAGDDPAKIARLPDTSGMKNEVIMQRLHRNVYDHAVRQVGVKLVEVGYGGGAQDWELEAALNENTAAIVHVYASWTRNRGLQLPDVVRIAHNHGVPVIVDAAAETPPFRNLRGLSETGADTVCFSGGKGIMGPQNTGLILGSKHWIALCARNGPPRHCLARSMKVAKEDMAGIVKAVELYVSWDHEAIQRRWVEQVDVVVSALQGIPGVKAERLDAGYSEGLPVARITLDSSQCRRTIAEVFDELENGEPGIRVSRGTDWFAVNPHFLEPGEEQLVAARLREIFST